MRARSLVLTLLALFFAVGAFLLAHAWLGNQPTTAPVAAQPAPAAHSVLVARSQLPLGQILKPSDLVWQAWPEGDVDDSYIVQGTRGPADFAGWVVRLPLGKGEPVTADKIVAPGDRGFFAAVLRTGMRAVSIGVDATSGIAGFVFPGDQVDILLTHTLPAEDQQQAAHKATETILRNVRVLAIDQKVSSKQTEPVLVHNVTVEVTPKQSEIIAVANAMGKLSLSLRSIARAEDDAEESAQIDPQSATDPQLQTDPQPMPAADRKHQTYTLDTQASRLLSGTGAFEPSHVTVIHGEQAEDVVFGVVHK